MMKTATAVRMTGSLACRPSELRNQRSLVRETAAFAFLYGILIFIATV